MKKATTICLTLGTLKYLAFVLLLFVSFTSHGQTTQQVQQAWQPVFDKLKQNQEAEKANDEERRQTNDTYFRDYGFSEEQLIDAIRANNIGKVSRMLATDMNPDRYLSYGNLGYTAIHLAAASGHREMIELLLSKGAGLNCGATETYDYKAGRTPLYAAMRNNQINTVKFLLSKGATVRKDDYKWAKKFGFYEIANLLDGRY
jgi:hypothetical protein